MINSTDSSSISPLTQMKHDGTKKRRTVIESVERARSSRGNCCWFSKFVFQVVLAFINHFKFVCPQIERLLHIVSNLSCGRNNPSKQKETSADLSCLLQSSNLLHTLKLGSFRSHPFSPKNMFEKVKHEPEGRMTIWYHMYAICPRNSNHSHPEFTPNHKTRRCKKLQFSFV